MQKKYNIGMDIGTTSVGWAVVESGTQKVMRKGNKKLWGVRLFEEANPASERRGYRSSRRRYDRRRARVKLLQEIFAQEIEKVDPKFYTKLKESFYHDSDVKNKTVLLTKNEREMIKKYHHQYPTIYHLRNHLLQSKEKMDIRLVYLAIHHMIKYRGNFLYNGDHFDVNDLNLDAKMVELFDSIVSLCPALGVTEEYATYLNISSFSDILLESSKNDRKRLLQDALTGVFPKTFISEFGKMVCGNKFNFTKMLSLDSENEIVELSFGGTDYEEKCDEYENVLGEHFEILEGMKQLFDMLFLKSLFKGSSNINLSSLMVEKYEIHQRDLRFLKDLFAVNRELYNKVFRNGQDMCLYEQYVHNHMSNEEFVKELKKYLPLIFESDVKESLLQEYTTKIQLRLTDGSFLPRLTDSENGKYPYQLSKDELIKIIENQGQYYPFLLDKVNANTYKIVRLLEFRIPYYVGPLTSDVNSPFAWMIRSTEGKITPYNFDEVIDHEATAERFIKRMISHCTYLLEEPAMPSNSILYSKYKVMNELKQIRVNGAKLTHSMQQKIFQELFLKVSGTITDEKFKTYLYSCRDFDMYGEDISITGYSADGKFANQMQSYIDFFGENGICSKTNYEMDAAEEMIEWVTIFSDKEILKKKLQRNYPDLSDEQVNKVLNKKYQGWSSLSQKLLTEKYYLDPESGTKKSIMDLMEETEENFMQIINNEKYQFQRMIDDYNHIDAKEKISYKLVENLATSPATKRGIYQALQVVEEIVDYIGYDPEYISIEMARGDEQKKRKDDRKKYLTKLYESTHHQLENYDILMKELNRQEKIDSQKLFLYFIQEGKSLYSGKPLDIENLANCEIDHIIPRSLIKDDSLDNKALVYREENQIKAANYVLPKEFRTEQNLKWWKHLKDLKLMSNKKFYNLVRSQYKDEDIEGFIHRQLVETRQITKHVANIMASYYKKTKVIYLKANLSHSYRERYDLFKFREINDYHHAHDAYLAAVLGEYKEKYMKKKVNFEMMKELNRQLLESQENKKLRYGYVINSLDSSVNTILSAIATTEEDGKTGEILFSADQFNQQVENTLYCNDILVSKKTEIKTGEFYNQTKNKKGPKGVCLKKNLPVELYGSYSRLNPSYAVSVKYTRKGKNLQKLIGIPIYVIERAKVDHQVLTDYVKDLLKLEETDKIELCDRKIPFYSLIEWDGQVGYLVGASDTVEVCNGKELHIDRELMKRVKYSLNKLFNYKDFPLEQEKYENDLVDLIRYTIDKMEKEYKLYSNLLSDLKEMVHYDDLSQLSLEEKESVLRELFKLLKCDSKCANFKFLNTKYSSAFGKKNQRVIEHALIKCKSVTGIREYSHEF